MAIREPKGVTSGKGTPQRMHGTNGDMSVRTTSKGKKLYVKDSNQWYGINLNVDTPTIHNDINDLSKQVRKLRKKNRNKPVLSSAVFKVPGSANVQLKNVGAVLKVRNADDSADADMVSKRLTLTTAVGSDAGQAGYDASSKTFKINSQFLFVNASHFADGTTASLMLASEAGSDSYLTFMDSSTHKWGLGYDQSDESKFKMFSGTWSSGVELLSLSNSVTTLSKGELLLNTINSNTDDSTTTALHLNYDHTAISASGETVNGIGLDLDMNCETVTHVGSVTQTGIDIDMVANTDGVQINTGMDIKCTGADSNYGMNITVPDEAGDYHIKLMAADDVDDYVTFKVADTGDLTIATVGDGTTDSDLILDVDGDIELNAAGGDIALKESLGPIAGLKAGVFDFFKDASSYARIGVTSSGVTTISTVDGTAADADFIIDAGGDITLDSGTGLFIAKNAGTEFSAANSAYAGMILGYTRIQNDDTDSGDANVAFSTVTMTPLITVAGTYLSINFKAPPSGNVEIQCSFWMQATSDGAKFSLSTGTVYSELDETHTYDADQTIYLDETDHNYNTIKFSVTGLTAGTDTTYYVAGLASGAGVILAHGRNRTGGTHYPPIILKAIALPATITAGE